MTRPVRNKGLKSGDSKGSRKDAALKHLKRVDPRFYKATSAHHASLPGELPERRTRKELFESLVSIVIAQQLGIAAANTITSNVKKACGRRVTSESVFKTREAELRRAGISAAKVKTLKSIAKAVGDNSLDLLVLKRLPESEASQQLLQIWGLGPWSVDMFMMNSLGREDVFSISDLGLVRAIEMIYDLPKNTPRTSLLAISKKWSPHRSYASLLLWRTRSAIIKDTKAD
ncbi:MAG: hypothetical protein Q7J45_00995 [bacterium]|nr:hypothetical protein [bacterium]